MMCETVIVHTYAPTGRRTRLAKSRVWKPVFNHDLSKKFVPMDKNKRLICYSPDFERVEFKQIVTVRDSREEPLSVRDMDEAVVHLFVNLFIYSFRSRLRLLRPSSCTLVLGFLTF